MHEYVHACAGTGLHGQHAESMLSFRPNWPDLRRSCCSKWPYWSNNLQELPMQASLAAPDTFRELEALRKLFPVKGG